MASVYFIVQAIIAELVALCNLWLWTRIRRFKSAG